MVNILTHQARDQATIGLFLFSQLSFSPRKILSLLTLDFFALESSFTILNFSPLFQVTHPLLLAGLLIHACFDLIGFEISNLSFPCTVSLSFLLMFLCQ